MKQLIYEHSGGAKKSFDKCKILHNILAKVWYNEWSGYLSSIRGRDLTEINVL